MEAIFSWPQYVEVRLSGAGSFKETSLCYHVHDDNSFDFPSPSAKDRIMEEHEQNVTAINNQLQMSRMRQQKR